MISYDPPAFQIDDIVKILKDTSPGAHPRYSYDKFGVIMSVVDGKGSSTHSIGPLAATRDWPDWKMV